jgi:hypothetical protein
VRNILFDKFLPNTLQWLPELGVGYYPISGSPYDQNYFQRYLELGQTEIGKALNEFRVEFVKKFTNERVVDIGIGAGDFMIKHGDCLGYDVNPYGKKFLRDNNLTAFPMQFEYPVMTFWDSIEHIEDVNKLLKNCQQWAFISTPIYRDAQHVLESKHFRKDEHCWYFTDEGLKKFMKAHGFESVEQNTMETELGREDIGTYAFKRV